MSIDRRISLAPLALAALLALAAAGCGGSSSSSPSATGGGKTLTGAGSTLVAPIVARWSVDYRKRAGVTVNYSPIGSGGGIAQVTARTVDFGASDAPLAPAQFAACKGCVQIPWALAATLVAYNLPGVTGRLKLTGPVVADIYLGKIANWNDPAIAKLNPGVKLPDLPIATVHRSDGSGDTYAFTDYLAHVSPAWKAKAGVGTEVSFPGGTGGKGNAGVAALTAQTKGAIGYVAIAQVESAHLQYALLRNRAGAYPDPSPATIAAAAATARFRPDHSASIVDPPASARNAYPLATFSYVLVPKDSKKLALLRAFIRYAVTTGRRLAAPLAFAPLPAQVRAVDLNAVAGL